MAGIFRRTTSLNVQWQLWQGYLRGKQVQQCVKHIEMGQLGYRLLAIPGL